MRILMLMSVLCLGSVVTPVQAHTHLEKTAPSNGARLSTAPRELILEFSEPTRLTAATLQREGEKQVIALKPFAKMAAATVKVSFDAALSAGKYRVTWRALGPDNHVVSGKFQFTIAP
jgi:copper resistance protein C